MSGFFDEDTPLTYKFGYYFKDQLHFLTPWNNNNFIETKLPLGTFTKQGNYDLQIVGKVSDSYGAETTLTKVINVKPSDKRMRALN